MARADTSSLTTIPKHLCTDRHMLVAKIGDSSAFLWAHLRLTGELRKVMVEAVQRPEHTAV
jgi:hypothetical protein